MCMRCMLGVAGKAVGRRGVERLAISRIAMGVLILMLSVLVIVYQSERIILKQIASIT